MQRLTSVQADMRREGERRQQADRAAFREQVAAAKPTRTFTAAELAGASHVRTRHGWYEVVRVNTSSVTVRGLLGPERLPFSRVLEEMSA